MSENGGKYASMLEQYIPGYRSGDAAKSIAGCMAAKLKERGAQPHAGYGMRFRGEFRVRERGPVHRDKFLITRQEFAENLHLASTQTLLKILPKDDPDYAQIEQECRDEAIKLFDDAVQQEKAWAKYLFKDGSMIGLNYQLLAEYVEFIANKRMEAVGLGKPYATKTNPLPWTQKWIAGSDVQVAPQETEISSYVQGGTVQDVDSNTFSGFSL